MSGAAGQVDDAASGSAVGELGPAPRRTLRSRLLLLLKLTLAGALLWVLFFKQDLLDPAALKKALASPVSLCVALLIGSLGISMSGLRWWILLRYEGIGISLANAVHLTWIGHFFNMVFPGAVSGDGVKIYYVGRQVPRELREEAWTTVLADRVIGMVALVSVSVVASLLNLEFVWSRVELRATLLTMLAIIGATLVGGLLLASGLLARGPISARLARLPFGPNLGRAYGVLVRLGRNWKGVLLAFAISFVAHGLAVANALILGRAAGAGDDLTFVQFSSLLPIALFANAFPITPGGIGVGEGVLGKLFQWSGAAAEDGVTVMLLYRGNFYVLAAVGALAYVAYRRHAVTADGSRGPS